MTLPKPYDLTTYDGKRVDWITRRALEQTAKRLGYDLTIVQGSYHTGVKASAGTHDGGGVVDLAPADAERKVRELRRTGFAAWHRPAIPGVWGEHIHAVLIGNAKLSAGAKAQVGEYLTGRDGLAGNGRDTGPRDFLTARFTWRTGPKVTNVSNARVLLAKALATATRPARRRKLEAALAVAPVR